MATVIRARFIGIVVAAAIAVGVTLAPPTIKPGNHCAKAVSGCTHGKFTGNFFGN